MSVNLDVPLSQEQQYNANQDTVRGQQVQLAEHPAGAGRYINPTIAKNSVYADPNNLIDCEAILGREASEITIESEDSDIWIRFEDLADPGSEITKFIHKNRAYTLDKHKVSKFYINNLLSGISATIVRIDMV